MPIANSFKYNAVNVETKFKLTLVFCENCKLVQLDEQPNPELMFHEEYPFFTGKSKSMTEHFNNLAFELRNKFEHGDLVIEIGCNDGTFLKNFLNSDVRSLGVDPSSSATTIAKNLGLDITNDFFTKSSSDLIIQKYGKAKIIFASNVICHIADITELAHAVSNTLDSNGEFVFEEPYLGDVLKLNSFDQIYDEHMYLFSIESVEAIFKEFDLKLYNAKKINTHGGSMRYFLSKDSNITETAEFIELKNLEGKLNLNKVETLKKFANNCEKLKKDFLDFVNHEIIINGKKLIGYPATSKSTTIINYLNLESSHIKAIYDSTIEKIGGFAPGTKIPVLSENIIFEADADYCFLFGWNHHKELLHKLSQNNLLNNVKWITHIPKFQVFSNLKELSSHLDKII